MRASSYARRRRRGIALGWVAVFVGLLSVGAIALWFVTSSTQKNIARASVAHAYYDMASSALAEINAKIADATDTGQPYQNIDYAKRLGPGYPPPPLTVAPDLTRKLAATLYPEMVVHDVTVVAVGRDMPGRADPLVGMLEMTVRVDGRVGGWSMACEVVHRIAFQVPCATWRTAGPAGSFLTPTWGTANVVAYPDAQVVRYP